MVAKNKTGSGWSLKIQTAYMQLGTKSYLKHSSRPYNNTVINGVCFTMCNNSSEQSNQTTEVLLTARYCWLSAPSPTAPAPFNSWACICCSRFISFSFCESASFTTSGDRQPCITPSMTCSLFTAELQCQQICLYSTCCSLFNWNNVCCMFIMFLVNLVMDFNTCSQVNSAFYPSREGKLSTALYLASIKVRCVHLCQVAGNRVGTHF